MYNEIYNPEYSELISSLGTVAVIFLLISLVNAYLWKMRKDADYTTKSRLMMWLNISIAILSFSFLLMPDDVFRKYELGQYRLLKVKESTFVVQQLKKSIISNDSLNCKEVVKGDYYARYSVEKWNNTFISKDSLEAVGFMIRAREVRKEEVKNSLKVRDVWLDSIRSVRVLDI